VVRFNLEDVDGDGSDFVFTANSGVESCLVMVLKVVGAKAEALPPAKTLMTKAEYFIVLRSIYFPDEMLQLLG